MIKNFKWLLLVSLTFVACTSDDEIGVDPNSSDGLPLTAGTADFSKYVALGDSFAAGYCDGALFIAGQEGSYPNILASQFSLVGGGLFTTPFMSDNIGGFLSGGIQDPSYGVRLYFGKKYDPINYPNNPLSDFDEPIKVDGISTTNISTVLTGPFNNLGIPGAKCIHLVTPGYGSVLGNPYFARFASSPTTTVLADATNQSPTFFSLWIGGNDVLGYALAGGDTTLNPITPSSGGIGVGFDASYNEIINQLTAGGRKGVIANLPYITSLPQFNYLKPTSIVDPFKYYLDGDENKKTRVVSNGDIATINAINSILGFLDQVLTAYGQGSRINILSTSVANPILIKDETLVDYGDQIRNAALGSGSPQLIALSNYLGDTFGKVRQTTTGDLIPLVSASVIGSSAALPPGLPSSLGKYGITYPLEDRHVLIPSEIADILAATDAYNITIKAAADEKGLAFVDSKAIMDQLSTSNTVIGSGFTFTSEFITGNTFSLDGIHPSPKGYALIANKFLEAINAKYGSNFKGVNLGQYRILFPAML